MSRAVAAVNPTPRASRKQSAARASADTYLGRSELPLTTLVFLLPLIVLYELGTRAFISDPVHQTEQRIKAFSMMQKFFLFFGAQGKYLPAVAVPVVLLIWHLMRKDKWKVSPAHVGGMALESLVLALPLIAIGRAAEQYLAHISLSMPTALALRPSGAKELLVLSLGAGVYEELVFRLILFALFSFVLVDVLKMNRKLACLLMVVASAALFSAYHYWDGEPFKWWTFTFRLVAGLYFGVIFFCRGFGITAGCHAAYDICVVGIGIIG